MTDDQRLATIGRPSIGGELITVHPTKYGQYGLRRWRRVNSARDEPRRLNVADVPADTMIYDLLETIEAIVEHAQAHDSLSLNLDDHGIDGTRSSLRERLAALAHGRVLGNGGKGR